MSHLKIAAIVTAGVVATAAAVMFVSLAMLAAELDAYDDRDYDHYFA